MLTMSKLKQASADVLLSEGRRPHASAGIKSKAHPLIDVNHSSSMKCGCCQNGGAISNCRDTELSSGSDVAAINVQLER
jgi:hypothetical protein